MSSLEYTYCFTLIIHLMKLKLNLSGSVEPLENYLKKFWRIRESLLLEIDTKERALVAKTYTEDRSCVCFSSVSFDSCGISIVSDDGEAERGDARIKLAIFQQLRKFIQVVERFGSEIGSDEDSHIEINITYDPLVNKDGTTDWCTTQTQFVSKLLKIKLDGFRVSEFNYISDETFKTRIFNVSDEVTVDIAPAAVLNIVKTSDIVKTDERLDALIFFNDGKKLYVKDQGNTEGATEPNFELFLGEFDKAPEYEILLSINRDKFIRMLNKTDETYRIILGKSAADGKVDRILFDSKESVTKIIIGAIRTS